MNGLAIDRVCRYAHHSEVLCQKKLVFTPRHADFFVYHTLNPARSEFLLRFVVQGANSFGAWNVGIWHELALDCRAALGAQC